MASASAQVLEIGVDQSPAGLDPHIITAFPSFMVVNGNIYEGLTAIDKDLEDRPPALPNPGPCRPDGKTYTFKLRSGVKFHDGSGHGRERCGRHDEARAVQGDRLAAGEPPRRRRDANAVDPTTVELKLKEPAAALLSSLATHRHRAERHGDEQGRPAEARRSAPGRSSSRNGSRTASSCSPRTTATGSRAYRSSRPQVQHRAGSATRQVGLTNGQYALCPTSTPPPRCSSRASRT